MSTTDAIQAALDAQDEREARFYRDMAEYARAEHAREPLTGDGLRRYQRVVRACDRAASSGPRPRLHDNPTTTDPDPPMTTTPNVPGAQASGTRGRSQPHVTPRRDTGRSRPRGYADWTPRPETAIVVEQVRGILHEYRDHLPLTVRQVFYRLVGAHDYPKDERAYKRLCEYIVRARRGRMIAFDAIRDDGITHYESDFYGGPADFWDDVGRRAHRHRRDRQIGQAQYVELWTEAAGMAPQLARVADRFSVPVFSAGGFVSLTAVRKIVDRATRRNVPTVLLHVGDYDPSGESIFNALVDDAREFVEADRVIHTQRITAVRVALTADQVDEYDLPTAPAKKTDSRAARWDAATCQLEALAPDDLAQIVQDEIDNLMDWTTLTQQIMREENEKTDLLRALPERT
ncbi:MAG: hypothetical protein M0P31_18910 [Solirubrobacteraceae bacterium]|nr:hypothetical protein [Solirubrobacteraceae bacterium]